MIKLNNSHFIRCSVITTATNLNMVHNPNRPFALPGYEKLQKSQIPVHYDENDGYLSFIMTF